MCDMHTRLRLTTVLALAGIPFALSAQNGNLVLTGSSLRFVTTGGVSVVLNNTDLSNNASTGSFVPGTGTVVFSGGNTATVGGTAGTSFYNLTGNKPGTELQLGNDISTSNTFTLTAGNVNLQNATLDLGTTGSVTGETYPAGNRLYCADGQAGRIKATRVLAAGNNADIAGLGLDITVTGTAPGSTVIYRGHDKQTGTAFPGAGTSIGRYYDVTPGTGSGFTYTLLFRYHDLEVGAMTESDFVFYRSPSHGANTADWEEWGKDNGTESPGYPSVGIAIHNSSANTVSLTGINTFSRWTVSNSVVNPLPVELVSFTATCADKGVNLRWATASEINNDHFTVHRSANLQSWQTLGTLPGAGNNNGLLFYTLTDERPFAGTTYYRLTQTDYDGTEESFAPVSVYCQGGAENRMTVFPNPASEYFTVSVAVAESQADTRLEICDLNGKPLIISRTALSEGSNDFLFDRAGLSAGTYYVRVIGGSLTLSPLKLILQ